MANRLPPVTNPHSPPSEYAAAGVITAASAALFIGVGYTNTYEVYQDYYQTTTFPGEPVEKLILIGSVASSLYFILGAFTGRFADVVGYRGSLILGSVLMTGAMFTASVSTTFVQMFLSQRLMFGVGLAFYYTPATSISRQLVDSSRHGMANGLVVSGGVPGGCILPFCTQVMISRCGLPGTFRILGYLAAGVLTPSVLFLRAETKSSRRSRTSLFDVTLLQDQRFLWLTNSCTVAMCGFLPRYFLIPSSALAQGISQTYSSWLLGMMNGLSIVGRIGIGFLADRYGKQTALASSFMLCGLGQLAFWLPVVTLSSDDKTGAVALLTVFVVYVEIFGSGFISLFPVVIAEQFGKENLASKTGMLNTAVGLSTLAGPSAVYAIIGSRVAKRWTIGVLVAGLFMIVGGSVQPAVRILTGNKERRRSQDGTDTGVV